MANTYLTKTFSSSPTNAKKGTVSLWFKLAEAVSGNTYHRIFATGADNSNRADINIDASNGRLAFTAGGADTQTNRLLRDQSAFYHLVISYDTTQATASDRVKFYINGVQETSFLTEAYPSQNADLDFGNNSYAHHIGNSPHFTPRFFHGIMSHFHYIDGTAYDATAFGEYDANGVWKIKTSPSVTYGTNGFFILKDGNSVTDQSGNGNNFTVGGGTLTNTEDSPSNVFATMNPLATNSNITLSNGNLTLQSSYGTDNASSYSTLGATQGKWYWELKYTTGTLATSARVAGVIHVDSFTFVNGERASTSGTAGIALLQDGSTENSGTTTSAGSYMSALSTGDIIGIALDCDNGQVKFNKNGGTFGSDLTFATNDNGYYSAIDMRTSSGTSKVEVNFGNGYFGTTAVASAGTNASGIGIFEYDVPTGYTALSTKGLNL